MKITASHIRELDQSAAREPVLVYDPTLDEAVTVLPHSTATERGARILYDADRLAEYTGGELDDTLADQLASELNAVL